MYAEAVHASEARSLLCQLDRTIKICRDALSAIHQQPRKFRMRRDVPKRCSFLQLVNSSLVPTPCI